MHGDMQTWIQAQTIQSSLLSPTTNDNKQSI